MGVYTFTFTSWLNKTSLITDASYANSRKTVFLAKIPREELSNVAKPTFRLNDTTKKGLARARFITRSAEWEAF
jgi:hypothetical protein